MFDTKTMPATLHMLSKAAFASRAIFSSRHDDEQTQ